MNWQPFYRVQDELDTRSSASVDAAEVALGLTLPPGYRELLTELGVGVISGVLRVYAPDQIAQEQLSYQQRIRDMWFFQDPAETMAPEYALESVVVADSLDGDEVIFHPGTRKLHVLPRHDERTHAAGADLWDVVAWFQEAGVLTRPHPFRYFEALVGPVEAANGSGDRAVGNRVIDAIDGLRIHDALEVDESDRTYFVKSIGGLISVFGSGDSVYTHIRYRSDRAPDARARLWSAAESAGIEWGEPWLTVP